MLSHKLRLKCKKMQMAKIAQGKQKKLYFYRGPSRKIEGNRSINIRMWVVKEGSP